MSALIPDNVSIATGVPCSPNNKDRGLETHPKTSRSYALKSNSQTYGGDLIPEFDERGKELDKEARVWKIYVKESDRWDTELVNGWNRSSDVILVFAALFSTISTVFLIESSRGLKEDPADTAAHILRDISQTLKAMTNSPEHPATTEAVSNSAVTPFEPSFLALFINGLWFMSLSLSVATSFLAMLAKEWCRSFMAGRSGHPYQQTRRRQKRWIMVEKWKMKELMMVLPSLMHLSLLLFAVGLCLYVWELNKIVTYPMLCVIGLAFGFYAWSSVMAILVDHFPYTTIISRFIRSDWLNQYLGGWGKSKAKMLWTDRIIIDDIPIQDEVTSQCLSWMINNCEVPYAIDAALQAISGASGLLQYHREPLDQCNAASKISRRLVSSNLWEDADRRRISLYIRALSFLGSQVQTGTSTGPEESTGELENLIWSFQAKYENQVVGLITDGKFVPSEDNLEALRIGSSIASYSIRLLDDNEEEQEVIAHFGNISRLIHNHYHGNCRLHPASIQSLLNTVEFLSASTSHCRIFIDILPLLFAATEDEDALPNKTLVGISLVQNLMAWRTSKNSNVSPLRFRAGELILELEEIRSKDTAKELLHAWSKLLAVLHNPWDFLAYPLTSDLEAMRQCAIDRMWQSFPKNSNYLRPPERIQVKVYLQDLVKVYHSGYSGTPISQIYYFMVESRCRDSQSGDEMWNLYAKLLSVFHFPKLSAELLDCLEQRNIIPLLEISSTSGIQHSVRFLAASQLWLLFALLSCPSGSSEDRARLKIQLKRYSAWTDSSQSAEQMRQITGFKLKPFISGLYRQRVRTYLAIYMDRILECMLQAGDHE